MAKKTAKQIVEQALPDMEIVESPANSASDAVKKMTKPGPSMSDLRRKYLGSDALHESNDEIGDEAGDEGARPSRSAARSPRPKSLRAKYLGPDSQEDAADEADAVAAEEDDVEVKQVRAKRTPADPADDPGPRAVIISKKDGMLGSQG